MDLLKNNIFLKKYFGIIKIKSIDYYILFLFREGKWGLLILVVGVGKWGLLILVVGVGFFLRLGNDV